MERGALKRARPRAWGALILTGAGALALAPHEQPPWRWHGAVEPPAPVPGAFGAAVAMSEGRLWIGPCQDRDLGQGPPQVWALGLATGTWTAVELPTLDRTAGFGLALAACGASAVIGAPTAGCKEGACHTGDAWLAHVTSVGQDSGQDEAALLGHLAPPVPEPGAQFGAAVALDERWLAVASPWATVNHTLHAGCVDVLDRTHQNKHVARLFSPRPCVSGHFGAALAMQDGTLLIGEPGAAGPAAPGTTPPRDGAVHEAVLRSGRWSVQSSLRAPAGALGWYGASLALAGDDLLVGAPRAGAVVHLVRATTATGPWRVVHLLQPPAPAAGFGCAVALNHAGTALIGASADSHAARFGGSAWLTDLATGAVQPAPLPGPQADQNLGAGVALWNGWGAVASAGNPEDSPPAPGLVHLLQQADLRGTPAALATPPAHATPLTRGSPRRRRPWRQQRQRRSLLAAASPCGLHAPRPPPHSASQRSRATAAGSRRR